MSERTRDRGLMRANVRVEIRWQLGNYAMALKWHDERLLEHALKQLQIIPISACVKGLISRTEKEDFEDYINEEKKRIKGEYLYGKL